MRRLGATFSVLALVSSLGIATPTAAQAALSGCGTQDYSRTYISGWIHPNLSSSGASAELPVRAAAVCDSDSGRQNFTNSWSMIAADDSRGWVQSGYERWWGSSFYFFSQTQRQQGTSGSLSTYYDTSQPLSVGSVFRFWQQYDTTCQCVHSNVNLRRLISTGWNPFTYWSQPFIPQFVSEARYTASDVPGNASVRQDFTKLQFQTTNNFSWAPMPTGMTSELQNESSRWAQSPINNQHVTSYTR